MAKKIRLTQEDEVIRLLNREGFREISSEELLREPYKSFAKMPDCFENKLHAKQEIRAQSEKNGKTRC
jgi:hypothetical protein